jgi:hypothetical protein
VWRKRNAADRAVDFRSIVAALFAVFVLAGMIWMATTGHNFCCDPKDLVGQLQSYFFAGR